MLLLTTLGVLGLPYAGLPKFWFLRNMKLDFSPPLSSGRMEALPAQTCTKAESVLLTCIKTPDGFLGETAWVVPREWDPGGLSPAPLLAWSNIRLCWAGPHTSSSFCRPVKWCADACLPLHQRQKDKCLFAKCLETIGWGDGSVQMSLVMGRIKGKKPCSSGANCRSLLRAGLVKNEQFTVLAF